MLLQTLDVIFNFDDGSDEITCAAFNPINPCLFAFADVSGNVGLRAIDRPLDAALAGVAQLEVAVNCMGKERDANFGCACIVPVRYDARRCRLVV